MKKINTEKALESAELLEFKAKKYINDVQEEMDIYNISLQISSSQIIKVFNQVIEVEKEEVTEETEVFRGSVHIKKDGSGKYYSVNNIHFYLTDFLEFGFDLLQKETNGKLIACAFFLIKLIEHLGYSLEEEQTIVCIVLYRVAKRYMVTDDNVIRYITEEMIQSDYIGLDERKIWNILSELIEMGIISVEDGRYRVVQELVFEY